MLFSYLTQLWDRPFENIDQEWELARRKPGIPRRVHSDSKSTGRGLYSMYFSYKRASQSTGGPDMRTIYLMDGGDWCKSNILVEAEVTDVEILDGTAFKGVLREILEVCQIVTSSALHSNI